LYTAYCEWVVPKRLIVGGFDGVYEFSKNFRNEGMDRHNPSLPMEIYATKTTTGWWNSETY
jgi:lysyl-tRNA synthetase class 2